MNKIKILITGSKNYNNKMQIKEFLFKFKKNFNNLNNDNYKIASLSNNLGADKYIKKYCIEFGLNYGEFNPYHEQHKLYSIMPKYLFNKNYHYKNIIIRDCHAAKWADYVIIFIKNSDELKYFEKIINSCKKNNKKIKILK